MTKEDILHGVSDIAAKAEAMKLSYEVDLKERNAIRELELEPFFLRLGKTWETPLLRLKSLTLICEELLFEIGEEFDSGKIQFDAKFDAATKLFCRIIKTSSEVYQLLVGGFSEGALSRWRTMHESSVILAVLTASDRLVSERFMDFQAILRFRSAEDFNCSLGSVGAAQLDGAFVGSLADAKNQVLKKYEKGFDSENGWARPLIKSDKKGRIKFSDIESIAGYESLRFQYLLANRYVHSGADSIDFLLDLSLSNKNMLLTGSSNEGLYQPIIYCGLTLVLAFSSIVGIFPGDDRDVFEKLAWLWYESLQAEAEDSQSALIELGRLHASMTDA